MKDSETASPAGRDPGPRNAYLVVAGDAQESLAPSPDERFERAFCLGDVRIWHRLDDIEVVSVGRAKADKAGIVALGHVYNPFSGRVGRTALEELAACWHHGRDAFLDGVSDLSGRFVLLVREADGSLFVLPDACASLPVAYALDAGRLVLGSHPALIGSLLALSDEPRVTRLLATRFYHIGIRHCPADLTEVQGVRRLTPNVGLRHVAGTLELQRVYPTRARIERPVEAVVDTVATALNASIDCLVRFERPVTCALSGGVDSRVSLAATVGHRDAIRFFTFSGDPKRNRDATCTRALARRLSLPFEDIALQRPLAEAAFQQRYLRLQGQTRAPNVSSVLFRRQHFGTGEGVEIRSCISEIARCFMKRKFRMRRLPMSAHTMVPLYKRVPFRMSWHRLIARAFDDWARRTEFELIERFGHDWLDFYYWEVRVGTWQSLVLQDSDYYCSPTVIFNNRTLLDLMLSVPEADRASDALQRRIIERLDPSVMQLPMVKNFGWKAALRERLESSYLKAYLPIYCGRPSGRTP